jgi:hypothetical protein
MDIAGNNFFHILLSLSRQYFVNNRPPLNFLTGNKKPGKLPGQKKEKNMKAGKTGPESILANSITSS